MGSEWNDSLRTGFDSIDVQHKALFRVVAALQKATPEYEASRTMRYAVGFLEVYVIEHFLAEERLAERFGYPLERLRTHRYEHDVFKRKLRETIKTYRKEGYTFETHSALASELARWTTEHVFGCDLELTRWVRKKMEELPP